jgi:hypothetical protein
LLRQHALLQGRLLLGGVGRPLRRALGFFFGFLPFVFGFFRGFVGFVFKSPRARDLGTQRKGAPSMI